MVGRDRPPKRGRPSRASSTSAGEDAAADAVSTAEDQLVIEELDVPDFTDMLRNHLKQLKSERGIKLLAERYSDKASAEILDFFGRLKRGADEVNGEDAVEAVGEDAVQVAGEDAMDLVGEGGNKAPLAVSLYDLAMKLSGGGRWKWYVKLVKEFGLGNSGTKSAAKKKAAKAAKAGGKDGNDEPPAEKGKGRGRGKGKEKVRGKGRAESPFVVDDDEEEAEFLPEDDEEEFLAEDEDDEDVDPGRARKRKRNE